MDHNNNLNNIDGASCRAAENGGKVISSEEDSGTEEGGAEGFQRASSHPIDSAGRSSMNADSEIRNYLEEASALMRGLGVSIFGHPNPSSTERNFVSLAKAIDDAKLNPSTINNIIKDVNDYVTSTIERVKQQPGL